MSVQDDKYKLCNAMVTTNWMLEVRIVESIVLNISTNLTLMNCLQVFIKKRND